MGSFTCLYVFFINRAKEYRNGWLMAGIRTFMLGFSILTFYFLLFSFIAAYSKYMNQKAWREYNDCLDEYTAIADDDFYEMRQVYLLALYATLFNFFIVVI